MVCGRVFSRFVQYRLARKRVQGRIGMDIRFIRSNNRLDQPIVTRQDGVRLSVPVFGPLEPIPHDLAHYVVEKTVGLRDGL